MVDEAHRLKNDDSLRTLIVFDTSYTITKLIKRTMGFDTLYNARKVN